MAQVSARLKSEDADGVSVSILTHHLQLITVTKELYRNTMVPKFFTNLKSQMCPGLQPAVDWLVESSKRSAARPRPSQNSGARVLCRILRSNRKSADCDTYGLD